MEIRGILVFVSLYLACAQLVSGYYVFKRDCKAYYEAGYRYSGVYVISPDYLPPFWVRYKHNFMKLFFFFQVYCDMVTDGGGWTVFQRRQDGSEDFYRYWADYNRGFGSLWQEHWLGLSRIHRVTYGASNTLRVDLEDFDGVKKYAKYSAFYVNDQETNYQLSVGGYDGNAGDSLSYHNGRPFTTRDRDNDGWGDNCAVTFTGAWWYNACHHSNLNGQYHAGSTSSFATGVVWYHFRNTHYYSLRVSEMKVRRNY